MLTPSTSRTPAHIVAKKTPMKLHAKIWAVVRQLLEPLHCEGCNITTDSYFTSLGLARDLLKAKKATLVGTIVTIRTNQVQLPEEFAAPAGRELYSSLVGFNETGDSSLVSYKCKKYKVVVILSTMHISDITFG